jgi:hypothetical protein
MSVLIKFLISEMVMVFKKKLVREGKRGEQKANKICRG